MACKKREEDKVLYKYNAIVLPQLYQTELLVVVDVGADQGWGGTLKTHMY